MQTITDWYMTNLNYLTITLLMAVESSFIPFPSEVVIPPAAWKAASGELNVVLVVIFGTIGSLIGALINYYLALWIGRPLLYKFAESKLGHMLLLDTHKVKKAEDYFIRKGDISTLIGRLIPGIRQLISIPAGLVKMNIKNFLLYTAIGAGIWNIVLAVVGYLAQGQADLINRYSSEISIVVVVLVVLAVAYIIYRTFFKKRKKTSIENNDKLQRD
ncbi:MAG: DedA family protein [Prevotellaceae bacterium]|nr:DedA family protein [Prevotellaceae bacterium]